MILNSHFFHPQALNQDHVWKTVLDTWEIANCSASLLHSLFEFILIFITRNKFIYFQLEYCHYVLFLTVSVIVIKLFLKIIFALKEHGICDSRFRINCFTLYLRKQKTSDTKKYLYSNFLLRETSYSCHHFMSFMWYFQFIANDSDV